MTIAIVLVLIAVGSVLFHFLSRWRFTPLASNWDQMDITLMITVVVTGIVFVAINFFIAYAVIRFRYQKGKRAAYEPENKKLEWWLIGLTSVGVVKYSRVDKSMLLIVVFMCINTALDTLHTNAFNDQSCFGSVGGSVSDSHGGQTGV
jgi:hypothetical protein